MENQTLESVVIDGGPCSGKTTGLIRIMEKLIEQGIIPFVIPEAATLLIQSGITPKLIGIKEFQNKVIKLQMDNENYWKTAGDQIIKYLGKPGVMFHDRGLLTGSAYLPLESGENQLEKFQKEILGEGNRHYNVEELRARYKGVIHLVTAAHGAEEYYTLANNSARMETPEEARALDQRTQDAWLGHPHLAVISNRDKNDSQISFEQKIKNALMEVYRIIGYPIPIELEDKFKLRSFDPRSLAIRHEAITLKQTYLVPDDVRFEERVRMRSWMNFSSYFHTIKYPGPSESGGRMEIERSITFKEYEQLLMRKNQNTASVMKTRYCFLWKNQYFEVDVFHGKLEGLILMERERTDKNDLTELPPSIDVEKDVTGEKTYSNFILAHT